MAADKNTAWKNMPIDGDPILSKPKKQQPPKPNPSPSPSPSPSPNPSPSPSPETNTEKSKALTYAIYAAVGMLVLSLIFKNKN